MSWILNCPIPYLVFVIIGSVLSLSQITKLKINTAPESMMVEGDPEKVYYEKIKETFGDDKMILIVVNTDDVFREEVLLEVENITSKCYDIDGVSRVVSLTTVNKIKGDEGSLDTAPLLDYVPSDPEELESVRRDALRNPLIVNDTISKDSKTTVINVFLESRPNETGYSQRITAKINTLMEDAKTRLVDAEIYQVGGSILEVTNVEYIIDDMKTVNPIALLVICIVFLVSFRSYVVVILPVVTGMLSILWTFGFMAAMGYEMTTISAIIPPLLLIIGCTEDVHMLSEYGLGIEAGKNKMNAIRSMAYKSGLAIFLTSLTTLLGFLCVSTSSIHMLKEFGICAAVGLAFNFVITITVIPNLLKVFAVPKRFSEKLEPSHSHNFIDKIENLVTHIIINHRLLVLMSVSAAIIVAMIGCYKIKIDTNFIGFFKESAPIRQAYTQIHKQMSGAMAFSIIVETDTENQIITPEILNDIASLQKFVNPFVDKTSSIADYIQLMNKEMNEGQDEFHKIPESKEAISQYLLMLDSEDVSKLIDYEQKIATISVRHNIAGTTELNMLLDKTRAFAQNSLSPNLKIEFTGETILINNGADAIAKGQVFGLSIALLVIMVMISILFMSVKAGILSIIPNLIPIVFNFGAMGLFGIPLNMATSLVGVIAVGIAVDDTLHFMVRLNKELQKTQDQEAALIQTVRHEIRPIMSTSIGLTLGFLVLMISNMVTSIQFGFLAAIVMISAVISDLFVLPLLLLRVHLLSAWDLMALKINDACIQSSILFKDLRSSELKKVVLLGVIKDFNDSNLIIRQGDNSQDIYLILEGKAEVIIESEEKNEKKLQEFKEGDIFGEISFVTGEPRTANVIASGSVKVLQINKESLGKVKQRFPRIAAKVYDNLSEILARRLKETTRSWANNTAV